MQWRLCKIYGKLGKNSWFDKTCQNLNYFIFWVVLRIRRKMLALEHFGVR